MQIKDLGVKAGVVLNPATPLESIQHVLHQVDLILLMSGEHDTITSVIAASLIIGSVTVSVCDCCACNGCLLLLLLLCLSLVCATPVTVPATAFSLVWDCLLC